MKPIFETCVPREDVLEGELKDEKFAASLNKVIDGRADQGYQDPAVFFENTYPTTGLKALLDAALVQHTGFWS